MGSLDGKVALPSGAARLASDATASWIGADFPIDGGNTAGTIIREAPGA